MNTPAFPSFNYITQEGRENPKGMTLRDYFAAKAMQAMLARADSRFTTTLEFVGAKSYQYADAMIKERNNAAQ